MVCRAPWSALAVTEQVFTMTRSASSGAAATAPAERSSSSNPSESAWLTRQPNVMTEYFMKPGRKADLRGAEPLERESPAADVAAVLHPFKRNVRHALVRPRNRFSKFVA